MPPGPQLIAGDLTGSPEAFDAIATLAAEYGWTDAGVVAKLCKGEPGQYTCHVNDKAKYSRLDFPFANELLFPAITAFEVGQCDTYLTQRPLIIEDNVEQLEKVTRELQQTPDYGKMLEDKTQGRV